MKSDLRLRGLTLVEALIVVLIIGMLAAMLYPVFGSMRMRLKVVGTVQRMKQFNVALQTYRQEWGGADVFTSFWSYYTVGLHPNILPGSDPQNPWGEGARYVWEPVDPVLPGIRPQDWLGPCAPISVGIPDQFEDGLDYGGAAGHVRMVAHQYDPLVMLKPVEGGGFTANWHLYKDYLTEYRENAVVLAEFYCNRLDPLVRSRHVSKRGIALLLSGQVVNKYDQGNWNDLRWFSPPAD
jgi:type II secretory pathway pseudopilin PulG